MKSDLEDIKKKVVPILKKAGVTRSAIFGSYARGDQNKRSDVDILIDLPDNKSLLDFVDLKLELEDILGKKVDLVEYKVIKPRIRESVMQNQIQLL